MSCSKAVHEAALEIGLQVSPPGCSGALVSALPEITLHDLNANEVRSWLALTKSLPMLAGQIPCVGMRWSLGRTG